MTAPKPTNVDEYIAAAPEAARPALERVRAILLEAAAGAVESLKWRQPAVSRQRIVACYAGFADHLNVMPSAETLEAFREEAEAAGCTVTRIVLRVPLDVPLPEDLLRRIAAHRAAAEAAGAPYST